MTPRKGYNQRLYTDNYDDINWKKSNGNDSRKINKESANKLKRKV